MPNQVSGFGWFNYFLDSFTPNEQQLNAAPVPDNTNFVADALDTNTDYTGRIYVQPVDKAGNPGNKVLFAPNTGAGTLHTLNPTPEQSPMSAQRVADIDAIVARCMAAGCGPGVTVAVVSPFGWMTKSYGGGVSNDGHFRIASQTKSFTAHAILRSVDQGLLSLDDKLDDYYPGVPNGNIITIRHMLMMQSGVYDYQLYPNLGMNFVLNPAGSMTVEQIMSYIKGGAPMFVPGEGFHYTNSNYYLLGKVLEAVDPAHRTADQIITQDIIAPSGLANTTLPMATSGPPAPADTHYDNNPILSIFGIIVKRNVNNQNPAYIWVSGAIYSVISDLVKWGLVMRDGLLLSADMHDQLLSTFSQQPASPRYGLARTGPPTYGYGLGFVQVGSWFGHDGSWLGADSTTMFLPGAGTVISVMENFQTSGLLALTLLWYELAEYLHPGSANYPGYQSDEANVGSAASQLGRISTAAEGAVYAVGEFQPFAEVNDEKTDEPVPPNATAALVTLGGGGGPGGRGAGNINQSGGSGGGGGGWETSHAEIDGVTVTGVNGQQGGTASMYGGNPGGSDTVNDGAAGGGAGGGNTNSGSPGAKGGDSLTQLGGAAGAPGKAPTDVDTAPPGHGGAGGGGGRGGPGYQYPGQPGGAGGKYGGGGGGGGCSWGSSPGAGGPGGDGLVLVEWE